MKILFNKMKNYFSSCTNFFDTKFDNDDFIIEYTKSFNITENFDGLTNILVNINNNSFNIFFFFFFFLFIFQKKNIKIF